MNNLIQENISLKDKNWFQTGGPARYYCEPKNSQEFQEALNWANNNKQDIFLLGEGANILISDDGFNGLIICPKIKDIKIISQDKTEALVEAGAGVKISDLINYCLENNLVGLEEFSGIPGTVGGSTYINIHFFEFLLSNFLVKAKVIEKSTGKILEVDNAWFNFGYDQSKLQEKNYFLLSSTFKLKPTSREEAAYALGRSHEMIRYRKWRYPSKLTCGSFFRNFHDDEVPFLINNKKIKSVAYYFDKLGIKGSLKIGGAEISHLHPNMIVNIGNATSQDIIDLAKEMQKLTFEKFGITPKTECVLLGFLKENTLGPRRFVPINK